MAVQLVHIPEIERLSLTTIRILGCNPGKFTLQGTNTYILGTGPRRILIDTGEGRPQWATNLKSVLDQENATIETAVITHWHGDHVGGLDDLKEICPGVSILKNDPGEGQKGLENDQVVGVEGATLRAIHTPGHTADHACLILTEEDAMFTADAVLGQGTAVFEDLASYMSSLAKMKDMFGGRAYPGHGPVIDDGTAKIAEYIEHRRQREEQVVRTMRAVNAAQGGESSDVWTAMDIVKVVYKEYPENLHVPAQGGVLQILRKLEKEGKAVAIEGGDGWRLGDRPTL